MELPAGAVDLWRIPLAIGVSMETLDAGECARAGRLRRSIDRHRFVASHVALRSILGEYVDQPPAALRFRLGPEGKPALADMPLDLRFNLAHSGSWALLGVTAAREIGVDIEIVEPRHVTPEITRRVTTPIEFEQLQALPDIERVDAFYTLWCRKEAYIKARGEGLSCPLDSFAVSFVRGDSPGLSWSTAGPEEIARWTWLDLQVAPAYRAAVVVEGPVTRMHVVEWSHPEP